MGDFAAGGAAGEEEVGAAWQNPPFDFALALIEPAILIVMGTVVVAILIALYLPIFSLGQASTMGGH